jgi:hypothetical protein
VEHCATTGICVWFHDAGFQLLSTGLWQLRQLTVVGKCALFLPVAAEPLWHRAQLLSVSIGAMVWLGRAPNQLLVLWQLSQPLVTPVCMGVVDLPVTP